jgi:hypothetical protein
VKSTTRTASLRNRSRRRQAAALFESVEPRLLMAFGLTTTSSTYTVDTGGGVVFSVLRQGTSSTIHSGDLTSFKLNGAEFAAPFASPGPQRYSHFESGLSNSAVVTASVDPAEVIGWDEDALRLLREDLHNHVFKTYKTYTSSMGVTLTNISEALAYAAWHDSLHLGVMISQRKLV